MAFAKCFGVCMLVVSGLCSVRSLPTGSNHVRVESKADGNNETKSQTLSTNVQSDGIHQDIRALNSDVIGFTVDLGSPLTDLPVGSTVVFDKVLYNAGSGYDRSTGIFTCSMSGLYLFYVNVEPVNETPAAAVVIEMNGSHRISAVAERYAAGHDSTGGNMLIQHMVEGDRVWVETYYQDNQDLYDGFTSFSGVLIRST